MSAVKEVNPPKVSVILTSFNHGKYIREAIDSVLNQTFVNFELIIWDDASSDNSWEIICSYKDNRIKAFQNEKNMGGGNLNRALDVVVGQYIAIHHSDDVWESDKLEKQVGFLDTHSEIGAVFTNALAIDERGMSLADTNHFYYNIFNQPNRTRYEWLNFFFFNGNALCHPSILIRKSCYEDCGVYRIGMAQLPDFDMWIRLCAKHEIHVMPDRLVKFRVFSNESNASGVRADSINRLGYEFYKVFQLNKDLLTSCDFFRVFPEAINYDRGENTDFEYIFARICLEQTSSACKQLIGYEILFEILNNSNRRIAVERYYNFTQKEFTLITGINNVLSRNDIRLYEKINSLNNSIAELNRVNADQARTIAELNRVNADQATTIAEILTSTSWRVTSVLRTIVRLLKNERPYVLGGVRNRILNHLKPFYWLLPEKYRKPLLNLCFKHFGFLFYGLPSYQQWRAIRYHKYAPVISNNQLLPIESILPCKTVSGRIAIHLHIYYADLADEFATYLANMPFDYDLFVSTPHAHASQICDRTFTGLPRIQKLIVEEVPNRGRDIAPMICTFGSRLKEYDYVAHLHSKKSLYNKGATDGWRQYLFSGLLGSEKQIRRIFTLLQEQPGNGIVYPQNYIGLPYWANTWLSNKSVGSGWCHRLGISNIPKGYFDYPAGSMFWARSQALSPLFEANITIQDFDEEAGQTDGTLAHSLERVLVLSTIKQGFKVAILQDPSNCRWSKWGFEQYATRQLQSIYDMFNQPNIKVIAFDIFDTLLIRPLLDAERVKDIVAHRVGGRVASLYLEYRVKAEALARQEAGKDVGLDQIYRKFASITTLVADEVEKIKHLEIETERSSVIVRSDGMQLFSRALATGKPVVLISDMFLQQEDLKVILESNGIIGWHGLFLSNQIGLRKDSGELYKTVFEHYSINANQLLMVGDNERSDIQIPCDMGVNGIHLLKPVEFARGMPRLNKIIVSNEVSCELHNELTLGLVLNKNFADINYNNLDPASMFEPSAYKIGYSLVGPMIAGFSQWLIENARRDKIECLYFLAREGQLIKKIYDLWCEGLTDTPTSKYLVLSRRAISVPSILKLQDIYDIAQVTYFTNSLENFLYDRFGLELSAVQWANLESETGLTSSSTIHIENKNINTLKPALNLLSYDIFEQAKKELGALRIYLDQMGFKQGQNVAVVDVGYAGTIQGYLKTILSIPVHGYYMMTDSRSRLVESQDELIFKGCYYENIDVKGMPPPMYAHSFELEKMLSSSDAQIVKYELDVLDNVIGKYRELSLQESDCANFRDDLQSGAIDFVMDALQIRNNLFPDFKPSIEIAKQLYNEFVRCPSEEEKIALREIFLDDHYCGRGVVN